MKELFITAIVDEHLRLIIFWPKLKAPQVPAAAREKEDANYEVNKKWKGDGLKRRQKL